MGGIRKQMNDYQNFVFTSFLVGNDFLPKIQMFMFLEDGLILLKRIVNTHSLDLYSSNVLNLSHFATLTHSLACLEKEYLLDQLNHVPDDPRFQNKTLEKCVTQNEQGRSLDFNKYRKEYYCKIFGETKPNINALCYQYLRGLIWVFKYYTTGLPSWDHLYPYNYAPLMTDLSNFVSHLTMNDIEELSSFEMGSPSKPFQQLLAVLPPSSFHYLPNDYSTLLSTLQTSEAYPTSFEIDYEGKIKEYQGIALLPRAPMDLIRQLEEKVKADYPQNRFGQNVQFSKSAQQRKYTSFYGELYHHIKCIKI